MPEDYESKIAEDLKTLLEFPGYRADNMSRFQEAYTSTDAEPSNTRYGWIRAGV